MEPIQRRERSGSIDGFVKPSTHGGPKTSSRPSLGRVPTPINSQPRPIGPTQSQEELPRYFSPHKEASKAQAIKRPKTKKWTRRRKLTTSALVILFLGFSVGAWYGARIIGSLDKVFHGNVFSDVHALFSDVKLKGEAQGRVNILLAGDSADDPDHQGADLTDSIMVVSIDTQNHTGFMLSIPRDLWVNVPGWGHEKINAANDVTNFNQSGYPQGGMGQLEQIVQTDLGIPIDYYALINYQAFKEAVDAVDGITINIQSPDPRGIYDAYTHLKLPDGMDKLTGQEALDLARARGDDASGDISYGLPNSDFDRTQHQRQMLVALAQKAKNIGVIANPIKVNGLVSAFGNNVQTDFNLQDVLRLIQVTKGMNITHLQSLTYSYGGGAKSLLTDYESPDGQSALVPTEGVDSFGQLQQYYQQLTSNNPVVREAPSVVILNGSSTSGLAHKMSTTLSSEGFNVVGAADAENQYSASMIVDMTNGQKPAAKQLLQTLLPKDETATTSTSTPAEATEAQGYTADFVVVLGTDAGSLQQP